jgi:hypothetical protein
MSTPEFDAQAAVQGFGARWKRVMTDPAGFFAEMPEVGGLGDPLVFLAICLAINAVGMVLVGYGLGGAIRSFVWGVVSTFVLAGALVLVAQHLFGGRAGFEPTFRVIAYAAAPDIFAWVPRIGVLALLYGLFLAVRGLERVQGFDTTRAVLTVLIAVTAVVLVAAALGGSIPHVL